MIKSCLANKKFKTTSGNQYRDFVHVDDLNDFFKGIPNLLDNKGMFVFEVSYLGSVIKKKLPKTWVNKTFQKAGKSKRIKVAHGSSSLQKSKANEKR